MITRWDRDVVEFLRSRSRTSPLAVAIIAITDVLALTSLLPELPTERTRLLDNLGRVRREVGPITPELSDALADHMNIRRGEVHEVVSFYSFLQQPADVVRVCTGPVCDCMRSREADGRSRSQSALEVACVGHCDLAPVRMDGDEIVGGVTHRTNGFLLEPDEPRDPAELSPDEVLARLEASGLTGMGGAGFPTFRKWAAVRNEPGPRVVIVNADEGEPGTIKDRYVMELRPHLLLEGLVAAMRFCETDEAFVYLREEYATSRARLLERDRRARRERPRRRRRRVVRLRRGVGDARVDGRAAAGCRVCVRRSPRRRATSAGRR